MGDLRSVEEMKKSWAGVRWRGIERPYTAEDVEKLRGTVHIEHSLARMGAERLWELLHTDDYLPALGALTGNQAIQQVEAGLKVIYLSGWQVAADANTAGQMYPDQSLYPADSVPAVVRRINNAFQRADQIQHADGRKRGPYWFAPIVADAEAGFGGPLNAFELMKAMIEAGAAGVHFEDQLASAKKCGHMGGKVLVPTKEADPETCSCPAGCRRLGRAYGSDRAHRCEWSFPDHQRHRRARSRIHDRRANRRRILPDPRRHRCGHRARSGLRSVCGHDLVRNFGAEPRRGARFAEGIQAKFPGKLLSYNCSPSFNWSAKLDEATIAHFQRSWRRWATSFSS